MGKDAKEAFVKEGEEILTRITDALRGGKR